MRNPLYAACISNCILRLHKEFPGLPIGEHIASALDGSDIYNISDKDFALALTNYLKELGELTDIVNSEENPDEYNE